MGWLSNVVYKEKNTYRGQEKRNCRKRHAFKQGLEEDSFVASVLEPHAIDGFLNDRVLVDPRAMTLRVIVVLELLRRTEREKLQ